jgi:hypothetical protein
MVPKSAIYWAICEWLETRHKIKDATECFNQMMRELGGEKNPHAELEEWIRGERVAHAVYIGIAVYVTTSRQTSSNVSPRNSSFVEI